MDRVKNPDEIKVEPYWNVKSDVKMIFTSAAFIKVEPYWNVKIGMARQVGDGVNIKVEPYWNVKLVKYLNHFSVNSLK